MKARQLRPWFLPLAITVVFAATLISLVLPAPAEGAARPLCITATATSSGCSISPYMPCKYARFDCRANPATSGWKQDREGGFKLICGPGTCLPTW